MAHTEFSPTDAHQEVVVLIDENGKWVGFKRNPRKKTLRQVYQDCIDANPASTAAQRIAYKLPRNDPTR